VSEDIPVVHIRQTRMIKGIKLAGATYDWLEFNTSWGDLDSETENAKSARRKVMAAHSRKVGKGRIYVVDLPDEEAESLWGILDSIAGAGESMSSEERGSDAYAYQVMRRDAERIRESLLAIGWTFEQRNRWFEDAVPPKEQR
jgi:hypothetical protein